MTTPSHRPDGRRIHIVGNIRSGSGNRTLEASLAPWLSEDVTLHLIRKPKALGAAVEAAIAAGADIVVAAGGDGTVNAVAAKLTGTGIDLGIIPLGTFNYVARGLDIPQDIAGAMAVLTTGTPRALPHGSINDRLFLNNAGLGIYPAILQKRERLYAKWGRSRRAALWAVVATMLRFRRPTRVKVTVDGTVARMRTPTAFAAFSAYQLRDMGMEGADCIEAGRIALVLAPDSDRWSLLRNLARIALRRARKDRDFALFSGTDIEVETGRRHALVAIDGERVRLAAPFRLRVDHDALMVIAP
jgi:diacylglycerol kinase family enzyme